MSWLQGDLPVGEVGPSIADLKNRVIFLLERLTIGLRYYSSLLTCGCQADLPKLLDLELFPPAVAPPGHSFLVMILLGDEPGTGNEQVWPLSQFFLFPFSKTSLICLEGKSMIPIWETLHIFRSTQQLPRLRLGPFKGPRSTHLIHCFGNYRDTRTLSGVSR